jgi:hypothetical protein
MADLRERFLIVAISWKGMDKAEELQPLFDTAIDWFRRSSSLWILWTSSPPSVWLTHIRKHLGPEDTVLIAELDLTTVGENYTGLQSKVFWDWLDGHRKKSIVPAASGSPPNLG